ncbi:MAG: immunity protein YezG family protein [Clostridium beijerinckii]
MNEKDYKLIADELVKVVPNGWRDIVFFGEFGEGSYSFEYFVKFDEDEYIQCFKLKSISKTEILGVFATINKILEAERAKLSNDNKWTNCTFVLNKSGKFKMDYDYTELGENLYAYQAVWKYKYLNVTPNPENKRARDAVDKYLKTNK